MSKKDELGLTEKDYSVIMELATREYKDCASTGSNFLCKCYVKAIFMELERHGWEIEKGKIKE